MLFGAIADVSPGKRSIGLRFSKAYPAVTRDLHGRAQHSYR